MGQMLKNIIGIVFLAGAFVVLFFWFFQKDKDVENVEVVKKILDVKNDKNVESVHEVPDARNDKNVEIEKDSDEKIIRDIILDVPFVLQAPFANWSDPLFEDACEEAAILMAKGWIEGRIFTSQQSFDEIKKIAEIEKDVLGEYIDASAKDTAEILKKYSKSQNVEVAEDVSIDDVISEISKGNLVIVPTNGRKLGNPNYTSPGPITHMIVIVGYDSVKKEFITNDSGTKNGRGYRYDENVLFEAIRDYPTGNHYKNPIKEENPQKTMIVVGK